MAVKPFELFCLGWGYHQRHALAGHTRTSSGSLNFSPQQGQFQASALTTGLPDFRLLIQNRTPHKGQIKRPRRSFSNSFSLISHLLTLASAGYPPTYDFRFPISGDALPEQRLVKREKIPGRPFSRMAPVLARLSGLRGSVTSARSMLRRKPREAFGAGNRSPGGWVLLVESSMPW